MFMINEKIPLQIFKRFTDNDIKSHKLILLNRFKQMLDEKSIYYSDVNLNLSSVKDVIDFEHSEVILYIQYQVGEI